MQSIKRTPDDLVDFIITEHSVDCMKCDTVEGYHGCDDSLEFADYLFKKGWRATVKTDILYCPKCAKKYLKKKK